MNEAKIEEFDTMKLMGIETGRYDPRNRFFESITKIFEECKEMAVKKNSDYTKLASNDPFHNFRDSDVQSFLDMNGVKAVDSVILDLLHEIGKKRKRIFNILLTGERLVFDETVEDTIQDSINYHAMLLTHLRMNGHNKSHEVAYVEKPEEVQQLQELKALYKENKDLNGRKNILEARLVDLEMQVIDLTKKKPGRPRKLPKAAK